MRIKTFVLASLFAVNAFAFNESFLSGSPVSYFSKEDTALFIRARDTALNRTKDGERVTWENPKTHSAGFLIPNNTTMQNGIKCRTLKIFNIANGVTGESNYKACKMNNEWKVVSN